MLFNRNPKPQAPVVSEPVSPEPEVLEPVEAPPAQNFVPKEDFDKLQTTIYQLQENMTNYFMTQNKPQQAASAPTTAPQIEDVSDEEYEDAIAGNIQDKRQAAAIVRKRQAADIARVTQPLMQRIEQLQSTGMTAISNLTAQGLTSKPHYARFKKEIDQAISQLPPEARVNAEALNGVYSYVVGSHIDEIMSLERETTLRQAAEKISATPTPRSASTSSISTAPPPTEVLDPYALAAIREKYGSTSLEHVERFAKAQGTKGWDEYYNRFIKPLEESSIN